MWRWQADCPSDGGRALAGARSFSISANEPGHSVPDSADGPQVVRQQDDALPAAAVSALVALRAGNPLTVEQEAALVAALLPVGRLLADGLRSAFASAVPPARRLAGRVQSGLNQFARAAEPVLLLLAQLQAEQLPNWPSPFSYAALRPLLEQDGLPVAWVPRAELLQLWVDAPDARARRLLLVRHKNEVVEDCGVFPTRSVLRTCKTPAL